VFESGSHRSLEMCVNHMVMQMHYLHKSRLALATGTSIRTKPSKPALWLCQP
jgi:hypothetical protein